MEIETGGYKGAVVITPTGDIDMYTSPFLRKELLSLAGRRVTPLIVDFRGVSYIDSSGIATLVEGLKIMMSYGGKLKFVGIPAGVMEIFSFSKLDKVFEIYGDIDDAVNS